MPVIHARIVRQDKRETWRRWNLIDAAFESLRWKTLIHEPTVCALFVAETFCGDNADRNRHRCRRELSGRLDCFSLPRISISFHRGDGLLRDERPCCRADTLFGNWHGDTAGGHFWLHSYGLRLAMT